MNLECTCGSYKCSTRRVRDFKDLILRKPWFHLTFPAVCAIPSALHCCQILEKFRLFLPIKLYIKYTKLKKRTLKIGFGFKTFQKFLYCINILVCHNHKFYYCQQKSLSNFGCASTNLDRQLKFCWDNI